MAAFGGNRRVILPSSSRRLRHLQAVLVRNLAPQHCGLVDAYFTLHVVRRERDGKAGGPATPPPEAPPPAAEPSDAPPVATETLLYTSEVVEGSVHPTWADIPHELAEGTKADVHETLFRVCVKAPAAAGKEAAVLLDKVVDIKEATYVGSALTDPNVRASTGEAMLFEFHDGIFVCGDVHGDGGAPPTAAELARAVAASEVSKEQVIRDYAVCSARALADLTQHGVDTTNLQSISDVRYNVTRLVSLHYSARAKEEKLKALRAKIAAALEGQRERRQLAYRREVTQTSIAELHRKIRLTEELLFRRRSALEKEKAALERETKALEDGEAALAARDDPAVARDIVAAFKQSIERNEHTAALKKQALVAGLRTVFPIEVSVAAAAAKNPGALTICRMQLSKDTTQATDDEAATALGYVAHCIQILSRTWDVPLRYPVFPIGSRSSIQERFIDGSLKDEHHCLYFTRGQKYMKSLQLLNKNIRQLLQFRDQANIDRENYMLSNLKQLLDSSDDHSDACDSED
eukprot:TRINITY_DN24850_c0_g1_i1.p1 TRINITY_DN24850_c0_g1~~TRINITY_DN24850_c0_g1_i1.p1  ORF type:complete len:520 (+),score=187.06 TRINITY_DN24850_c0_g1_i1:53-1612(+)